jgi:UDP-N-acetylglucosamine 4,6-dehydratase/5-epimerase
MVVIPLNPGFAYNSGSNPNFLKIEQLREQIRLHVDPEFTI